MRNKKQLNQSLFDFVLSNYGSLEYIYLFMKTNNIKTMLDFENIAVGTSLKITKVSNSFLTDLIVNNIISVTGYTERTIGDFNDDFNNDFNG